MVPYQRPPDMQNWIDIMGIFKPNIEKLRNQTNTKGLLKALSYKEASVRSSAVDAIGQMFEGYHENRSKDAAVEALTKMLVDADPGVLEATVYALGNMRQAGPLIRVLKSGETPLRIIAAEVLGWNSQNISVNDALASALQKDGDEAVRANAAISLGRIVEDRKRQFDQYQEVYDQKVVDDCCLVLEKALGDSPAVYSNALWALARSKKSTVVPHLIKGLGGDSERVREKAAVGLDMMRSAIGKEEIDTLAKTVQNVHESKEMREGAIRALGVVQIEPAMQALLLLRDSATADEFKTTIEDALGQYPSRIQSAAKQPAQMGQYWAYLHKYGKILIKEWYEGNAYISEAMTSENVKQFLEEPFEAASMEEAQEIAARLLNSD